jgi:uncharacterized membrane protein YidH (DUF202 family)
MYTLSILILILGIYSVYDVKKKIGKWKDFNPFKGNIISFSVSIIIMCISIAFIILFLTTLIVKYLP